MFAFELMFYAVAILGITIGAVTYRHVDENTVRLLLDGLG